MGSRRINLADYIERRHAADGIVVELADGEVVIPPSELWPDEAFRALDTGDVATAVQLILGVEQFERFTAEGGNWRILNGIVRELQGVDVGESGASPSS